MSEEKPEKKEKTYQTGRHSKKEELMQTIQEAQAPLTKTIGNMATLVTKQQERLTTLEDNQTQFVKILEEMRAPNPQGNPQQPGQNMPAGGQNMGGFLQQMLYREMMGGGQNPTKMALDIAREFNKTYMVGQRNMLTMIGLISRKKSLDDIFGKEE